MTTTTTPLRRHARGFTLVEMLVALLVASLFIIGMLQILDTSSRLSKNESALSDTQENVRYGAYSIMRAARMTGGAGMAFSTTGGLWIAAQVLNNQSGTINVDLNARSITVAPSSDVLILRGFFEQAPFFTAPSSVAANQVRVQENPSPTFVLRNPLDAVPSAAAFQHRLLCFMGQLRDAGKQGTWWIGKVTGAGGSVADSGGSEGKVLTLPFEAAGAFNALNAANLTGTSATQPGFDVYRVGVLESYVFYVNPEMELHRLRNSLAASSNGIDQVLAIDVGNLQFATGVDNNSDGEVDAWLDTPTAAALATNPPIAIRITVLGRTPHPVLEWNEPVGTFAVEDLPLSAVDRSAKWRRMQVVATLRNYTL